VSVHIPVANNSSTSLEYLRHYAFRHGRTIIVHECAKALRELLKATEKQQEVIQLYIKWKSENLLLQINEFSTNKTCITVHSLPVQSNRKWKSHTDFVSWQQTWYTFFCYTPTAFSI